MTILPVFSGKQSTENKKKIYMQVLTITSRNMFVICKADFSVNADNNDLSGDNNDSKVFFVLPCKYLNYPTTNVQNSLNCDIFVYY